MFYFLLTYDLHAWVSEGALPHSTQHIFKLLSYKNIFIIIFWLKMSHDLNNLKPQIGVLKFLQREHRDRKYLLALSQGDSWGQNLSPTIACATPGHESQAILA